LVSQDAVLGNMTAGIVAELTDRLLALEQRMRALRRQIEAGDDPVFTVKTAAAYLCLKPVTVGDLVRKGELSHSRVGRLVRIRRSDCDAMLAARRVAATRRIA